MVHKMDNILKGAIDFHVHCSPDAVTRSVNDLEMAKEALDNGMGGFVLKNHYTPTAGRAGLVQSLYPELKVIGSVTLNSAVGGINPMAVETMARMGGKVVWFPTFDSSLQLSTLSDKTQYTGMQAKLIEKGMPCPAIRVVESNGKISEEAHLVLKIIAEYDLVLATGHIAHKEAYELVKTAREEHIERIILTHVDCPMTRYTMEEQRPFLELGAIMERSYMNVLDDKISWDLVCEEIREAGVQNVLFSTDLGQKRLMNPVKGLRECAERLLASRFSEDEVHLMIAKTPAMLIA